MENKTGEEMGKDMRTAVISIPSHCDFSLGALHLQATSYLFRQVHYVSGCLHGGSNPKP